MVHVDDFREALLAQRRALLRRVADTEEDLRWLDTHVARETTEEGQEEAIARLLVRLDERGRAELDAIDAALARIATGDYGRCQTCGEPIPEERLRIVPATCHCLRCEERAERTGR